MPNTSRVFAVQIPLMRNADGVWVPKWDISAAEEYGIIIPVLAAGTLSDRIDQTIAEATAVLKNYSDDDYLLAIGNPTLIACCAAIAAHYNNGYINMLEWNRTNGCYDARECWIWQ